MSDRGGLTKYGISQRTYPNIDIRNLTWSGALELYYQDFWLKVRGDDLPYCVALPALDMIINHRPKQAKQILQRALGVKPDGQIGPVTIKAARRRAKDSDFFVDLVAFRSVFYTKIIKNDPSQMDFVLGWMRRAAYIAGVASRSR